MFRTVTPSCRDDQTISERASDFLPPNRGHAVLGTNVKHSVDALAGFGRIWPDLAGFGRFCPHLSSFVRFCPLLPSYDLIFNGLGLSRSFRRDVLCDAHATFMRCACDAQASFKPGSCDVHAMFMRRSCDGYATLMRWVCDGYATLCDNFAGNEGGFTMG